MAYIDFLNGVQIPLSYINKGKLPVDVKTLAQSVDDVLTNLNDSGRFEGLFIYIIDEKQFYSFQNGITDDCFKPVGGTTTDSVSFEEFDKTKTYTIGDYVIYNRRL